MSLINEALKRAREAQQAAAPPAPGPEFRPIEAAQTTGRGIGLMVPLAFLTIALIGLFFAWQVRQKSARSESPALAMPTAPVAATAAPAAKPQPSAPVQAITTSTPGPAMIPTAAAKPLDQPPVATPAPAPVAVVMTNIPAPAFRLQMITYLPGHPSAVISGKTVQAGDAVKGFRIAAITQNSVTLVSATETNVLALDQ